MGLTLNFFARSATLFEPRTIKDARMHSLIELGVTFVSGSVALRGE
jgi:hypothetical protein